MIVYSAARIILTFGAASLMTVVTALPLVAQPRTAGSPARPAEPDAERITVCKAGEQAQQASFRPSKVIDEAGRVHRA